jgi:hypothetical protein
MYSMLLNLKNLWADSEYTSLPLFPSDSGQGVEGLARDQWAPSSVAVLIVHIPPIMVVVILDTDV